MLSHQFSSQAELEQMDDPEMRESAAIEINNTMQLLCNLILVEGTLDQSAADQLSGIIQRSLAALATLEASDEKDSATSMCLNLLGRMATLTSIGTDTDATANIVGGFMDDISTSGKCTLQGKTWSNPIQHKRRELKYTSKQTWL